MAALDAYHPAMRQIPYTASRTIAIGDYRQFGRTVTLRRRAAGTRNQYGEWAEGAPLPDREIPAATRPNYRHRSVMVDGIETEADRTFWTSLLLRAATPTTESDFLILDGETWRIIGVDRWNEGLYESQALRAVPQTSVAQVSGTSSIERTVRGFVSAGSGIAATGVIPAHGPGPRPPGVHATVQFVDDSQEGYRAERYSQNATSARADIELLRDATARVQFWRTGAWAAARQFAGWIETPAGQQQAVARGITVDLPQQISDQPVEIAGQWEEGAAIDLHIGYSQNVNPSLDRIERYELTARLGNSESTGVIRNGGN